MIYAVILILFVMSRINNALGKLEHKQKILCYDMLILTQKIREDENRLLS